MEDLEELSKEAKSIGTADAVLRIQGLIIVSRWHPYWEIAQCLGVTIGIVSKWVSNFECEGYQGLLTKPRFGRPAELAEEELLLLDDLVDAGAVASGFPASCGIRNVWPLFSAHISASGITRITWRSFSGHEASAYSNH